MRVNLWGINYAPEPTGIAPYNAALCHHLKQAGHEVDCVTSFAYYPAWKKRPEDRGRLFRTDAIDGVRVHRCWHYVPSHVSALKRIVHEGSFVLMSFLRQLALPAPDAYVVVSPPLLLGAAAWLLGLIKRRPFVFHVQDLQPDAAAGLGMLKEGALIRALYGLEKLAYRKAARVSGITPGMLRAFFSKGVPEAKLVLFPNGVVLPEPSSLPSRGAFRARHGFAADDFLAVYSGNLGVKQGLDILIDAARELRDPRVRILICGEGARRASLEERVRRHGLANVTMLPLQPDAAYRELLVDADVCVITQQAGSGSCFFPSKLLTTLACSKPVVTVASEDSELVHALREGRFGVNVLPGRPAELSAVLESLARDPSTLQDHAEAGRAFVAQFEMSRVLVRFTAELEKLVAEQTLSRTATLPGGRVVPSRLTGS